MTVIYVLPKATSPFLSVSLIYNKPSVVADSGGIYASCTITLCIEANGPTISRYLSSSLSATVLSVTVVSDGTVRYGLPRLDPGACRLKCPHVVKISIVKVSEPALMASHVNVRDVSSVSVVVLA